jgi:hypothetical protein
LTKHLHDEALKLNLTIEDPKIEVVPKIIDNTNAIFSAHAVQPKKTHTAHIVKPTMAPKKTSKLQQATRQLYDLEASNETEKPLKIDLDLYQMESY